MSVNKSKKCNFAFYIFTLKVILNIYKPLIALLYCLLLFFETNAQTINWKKQNDWVDSVFATLTPDQQIAQLMIIGAFSNKDKAHVQDIECHIRELGVGGLIFFKGTPVPDGFFTPFKFVLPIGYPDVMLVHASGIKGLGK